MANNTKVETTRRTEEILADLDAGIALLNSAIGKIKADGDAYYAAGNNHRGNIRVDAVLALRAHVNQVNYDYLRTALSKGKSSDGVDES